MFDLFAALDASEEQLDFPVLYGSAKQGWMALSPDGPKESIAPLLDKVLEHVAPPEVEAGPFRMLATTLEADPFLGRLLTGRIRSGSVKAGQTVKALSRTGETVETFRVSKVLAFRGLERAADRAWARRATSSRSRACRRRASPIRSAIHRSTEPIPAQPIDPPTLAMTFRINDGPLAGTEGDKVQSRVIRDRLLREAEGNVALKITEGEDKDAFEVAGRGELQLGILIETMRREGFELTIGKPRVVTREENGVTLEPIEEVIIDVDDAHTGIVIETLSSRRGELDRDAAVGRRPHAAPLQHPDARPDRLPAAASLRHARHRDHEPHLSRLGAVSRRDSRPPHRRASVELARAKPSPTRSSTCRIAGR